MDGSMHRAEWASWATSCWRHVGIECAIGHVHSVNIRMRYFLPDVQEQTVDVGLPHCNIEHVCQPVMLCWSANAEGPSVHV